jgi:hypothetical protein
MKTNTNAKDGFARSSGQRSKAANARDHATMMGRPLNIALLCTVILFCLPIMVQGEQKTISQNGVSLTYDTATFSKVEILELKREPLPHPHDQLNVHPANLLFLFYTGPNCVGSIKLYPLEDRSVGDLKMAYPELSARARTLIRVLNERPELPQRYPDGIPKEIPTIQNQMAGQYFLSHVRYLDFSWGSSVGFLVQYAQDSSAYAAGSRLDYQIEGMNAHNKIAVSAYFSVSHPDLLRIEKDGLVTNENGEPLGEVAYSKYLRKMEKFLDTKQDATFQPSLELIQRLVNSLRFENADPSGWGSKFSGKTTVID